MKRNWKVSKFGGSSLSNATAIKRCVNIVRSDPDVKIVVVSATQHTTNRLERVATAALTDIDQAISEWQNLYDDHLVLAAELGILAQFRAQSREIDDTAETVIPAINKAGCVDVDLMDEIYSWGERMSSALLSIYLQVPCVDARLVLKTNHEYGCASPLIRETCHAVEQVLVPEIARCNLIVTQGFLGGTLNGKTTTLGRDGSDFSAVLFAEAIDASTCVIWTDVPGIATGDPRIVNDASYIPSLSYTQATRMAATGANVLFPRTLEPAVRSGIVVYVKSSLDNNAPGTTIKNQVVEDPKLLAVTCMNENNNTVVNILGQKLLRLPNFYPEAWLTKCGIEFELYQQDGSRFSFAVDDDQKSAAICALHDYLITFRATQMLNVKSENNRYMNNSVEQIMGQHSD